MLDHPASVMVSTPNIGCVIGLGKLQIVHLLLHVDVVSVDRGKVGWKMSSKVESIPCNKAL